jgi:hypothetical protein
MPVLDTFSGEIDRIAEPPHPATLHCCPLPTFPKEINPRWVIVLEKDGSAGPLIDDFLRRLLGAEPVACETVIRRCRLCAREDRNC